MYVRIDQMNIQFAQLFWQFVQFKSDKLEIGNVSSTFRRRRFDLRPRGAGCGQEGIKQHDMFLVWG